MSHAFDRWLECGALLANVRMLLGEWAFVLVPGVVADQKRSHKMLYDLVAENAARIKRNEQVNCIMDDTYQTGIKEGMTEEHLQNALMNVLFAGHDTTAALLSLMTYELSKRPDLQAAIRAEVEEVNGKGDLDNLEVLEKCKVLNACIKETLRKYPSAPYGALRTAFEDFTCNYTDAFGKPKKVNFQKDDLIFVGIHAMQNAPWYWDKDPSIWTPERYYEDANGGSKAGLWSNAPFGNGARRCVGERLALAEGRLATASILRKFDILPVPEGPDTWQFKEIFSGTIKPNKVMVKLRPLAA
ncbi:cytochrome P450 [Hyaloraphidium curvatum]|nr:cytochrome P450 [Hyaloraphidium curvatum]